MLFSNRLTNVFTKSLKNRFDFSGMLSKLTFFSPDLSTTRRGLRPRFPWKCGSRRFRRLCMLRVLSNSSGSSISVVKLVH